jgi:hypothetical protein
VALFNIEEMDFPGRIQVENSSGGSADPYALVLVLKKRSNLENGI